MFCLNKHWCRKMLHLQPLKIKATDVEWSVTCLVVIWSFVLLLSLLAIVFQKGNMLYLSSWTSSTWIHTVNYWTLSELSITKLGHITKFTYHYTPEQKTPVVKKIPGGDYHSLAMAPIIITSIFLLLVSIYTCCNYRNTTRILSY